MNSKPFEIRYLIAHAFNAPVRSSFTRKGPEKLCGSEKFLGSFEKRRNYFLFFTFHANSWRRVIVYTSNTMATLSHGCKPISLTDKTVFPLIYALCAVVIYNDHTILIGTVFLHVPHMQLMNQPFQGNIQPYNFFRNVYPRRGSRNLLEFGKKLGKIGVNPVRGGLFLFERRILRVQEFSIILYFLFLFCFVLFCFFYNTFMYDKVLLGMWQLTL